MIYVPTHLWDWCWRYIWWLSHCGAFQIGSTVVQQVIYYVQMLWCSFMNACNQSEIVLFALCTGPAVERPLCLIPFTMPKSSMIIGGGRNDPFFLFPLTVPRNKAIHAPIPACSPWFSLAQSHLTLLHSHYVRARLQDCYRGDHHSRVAKVVVGLASPAAGSGGTGCHAASMELLNTYTCNVWSSYNIVQ